MKNMLIATFITTLTTFCVCAYFLPIVTIIAMIAIFGSIILISLAYTPHPTFNVILYTIPFALCIILTMYLFSGLLVLIPMIFSVLLSLLYFVLFLYLCLYLLFY